MQPGTRKPRRATLGIFFVLLLGSAPFAMGIEPSRPEASLYQQFRDPPRQFGLMPYWFWNGNITPDETRRQIHLMIEQGVNSAIVFPWDGMEVPYLSEAWWKAFGDALETAEELGFTLNLNDEFTWPSGHAWDHYQQGAELSWVLAECPAYRMKTLAVEMVDLQGQRRQEYAQDYRGQQ